MGESAIVLGFCRKKNDGGPHISLFQNPDTKLARLTSSSPPIATKKVTQKIVVSRRQAQILSLTPLSLVRPRRRLSLAPTAGMLTPSRADRVKAGRSCGHRQAWP